MPELIACSQAAPLGGVTTLYGGVLQNNSAVLRLLASGTVGR